MPFVLWLRFLEENMFQQYTITRVTWNIFSRIRRIGKDKNDLYAGGVLQQNIFNQISNINNQMGNSSYSTNTISKESNPAQSKVKEIAKYINEKN